MVFVQLSVKVSDPDPDPGRPKLPHKKEEKKRISCFEEIEVLHGFYRSFEILHGDPIRNILKLLIYRM
jgi:hypothetical protein